VLHEHPNGRRVLASVVTSCSFERKRHTVSRSLRLFLPAGLRESSPAQGLGLAALATAPKLEQHPEVVPARAREKKTVRPVRSYELRHSGAATDTQKITKHEKLPLTHIAGVNTRGAKWARSLVLRVARVLGVVLRLAQIRREDLSVPTAAAAAAAGRRRRRREPELELALGTARAPEPKAEVSRGRAPHEPRALELPHVLQAGQWGKRGGRQESGA